MSGSRLGRAVLTARTVRHMKPAQVVHRLRLRGQRALLAGMPESALAPRRQRRPGPPGRWPPGFLPLPGDAGCTHSPTEIASGRFTFLGETFDLGSPPDWVQADAPHLWRYHLHYFDWAWAFARHPDRAWARDTFAGLWSSWDDRTRLGRGDAWSPYVASLRAWSLCAAFPDLVGGSPIESRVLADLDRHATFLRAHLELDVGGNHLLKNLKALVGLAIFLARPALLDTATSHIRRQLRIQILEDGGHFERSPSYHCQVLGDLVDVAGLLAAAGRPPIPGLDDAIGSMRQWLGLMLLPDGDVPLFNDCSAVPAAWLVRLRPGPPAPVGLTMLAASGYAVMRPDDRLHLVADVGPPCPPELPAHAHADCLSFELCVDGRRVIVNSGTSTYESGLRRAYERSTEAHSTVGVDGQDQTEVWGTFRAARRAQATVHRATDSGVLELVASHDGYRRLAGSVGHRRTWRVARGTVAVTDEIEGRGDHLVAARLYLSPALGINDGPDGSIAAGPINIEVVGRPGTTTEVQTAQVSRGFGPTEAATRVVTTVTGPLPVKIETVLRLPPSSAGNGFAG